MKVETIVFDLGGVLIDWNPRHLYRKIFDKEEEMEWFLANVCTMDWNVEQDSGRPWADAVEELLPRFPEYHEQIKAYDQRWTEMLGGPIEETVSTLRSLIGQGNHRVLALTNWSAEKFPIARERYDFLGLFEDILVSGEEGMRKPHREIYELLLTRYDIDPEKSVFIDDSLSNVEGAREVGMQAIHYQSHDQFISQLQPML